MKLNVRRDKRGNAEVIAVTDREDGWLLVKGTYKGVQAPKEVQVHNVADDVIKALEAGDQSVQGNILETDPLTPSVYHPVGRTVLSYCHPKPDGNGDALVVVEAIIEVVPAAPKRQ